MLLCSALLGRACCIGIAHGHPDGSVLVAATTAWVMETSERSRDAQMATAASRRVWHSRCCPEVGATVCLCRCLSLRAWALMPLLLPLCLRCTLLCRCCPWLSVAAGACTSCAACCGALAPPLPAGEVLLAAPACCILLEQRCCHVTTGR